jgi:phosphatidylserine/phosphatidylglycerophosphate/cardiolipin synthase-like enzyme
LAQKVSLIVQPGDSFFPIVRAIDKAERCINLTVFRMDDPIIQRALVEAHARRVRIRVLISSSARGWEERNQKLLKEARKVGIATKEPSGDKKKARYHYKVMTVDESVALVFTFNPTRENLHYTRDFGIEVYNPQVATEIDRLFAADWDNTSFTPNEDSPLLISPFNSRKKMNDILEGAEKSIHIADAKVEDPAIVQLLVNKARSGVEVRILGSQHGAPLPSSLDSRAIPRFKLHAKCTIVDGKRAVIGSMNLRTESFDKRREVSIVVDDPDALKRLNAVFTSDWEQKAPVSSGAVTMIVGKFDLPDARPNVLAEKGLFLISRTDALVRYSLPQGTTSLGRAEENNIVICEALVSRQHATITRDQNGCMITDLESGNGTYVNGERIQGSAVLKLGDIVDLGGAQEFRLLEL